jgi:serine/threonine protein kinase
MASLEDTMREKLGLTEIVLADFSLAKKLRVLNSREVMTPGYCAPETPEGLHGTTSSYGCKVDVYSLGCTLYEVLTGGKFLPEGPDPIKMLKQHMKNQYKTIGTNMSILIGLIEDMLHPNPSSRPSTDSLLQTYTKALFRSGFSGMGEELSTKHRLTTVQISDKVHLSKLNQICDETVDLLKHVDSDLRNETISLLKYFVMRYNMKTNSDFFQEELKDTSVSLWICVCYFLVWSYYVGDGRACKAISIDSTSRREKQSSRPTKFVKFAVGEHLFDYDTFIQAYWLVVRLTSFKILFDNRHFIFHDFV